MHRENTRCGTLVPVANEELNSFSVYLMSVSSPIVSLSCNFNLVVLVRHIYDRQRVLVEVEADLEVKTRKPNGSWHS